MAAGDPTTGETSAGSDALAGMGDLISGGLKGVSGILEGIMNVVSKMFSSIIDASPMLQGVLKIVDKMFKMILMPIGNMIARLLLPVAIKMANKTMQFLSKFGNAGPDQLEEMMEAGMTIALDSFIEMIGVILTKVLVPIFKGLASAIVNAIKGIFGGGSEEDYGASQFSFGAEDISLLMGGASEGFVNVIDQFGMTVQTGNKEIGTSQTELATVFYTGAVDIANGFQSLHDVLAIGTPGILSKFENEFNTAAAGVYTSIDTLKESFGTLSDFLDQFVIDHTEQEEEEEPEKKEDKWGALDWAAFAISPTLKMIDTWSRGYKFGGGKRRDVSELTEEELYYARYPRSGYKQFANGGLATKPTKAIIGESGPEAVIPLNKLKGNGGQNIEIHINGDIYGMDDFNRKIEQAVGKYSSKLRGAY